MGDRVSGETGTQALRRSRDAHVTPDTTPEDSGIGERDGRGEGQNNDRLWITTDKTGISA